MLSAEGEPTRPIKPRRPSGKKNIFKIRECPRSTLSTRPKKLKLRRLYGKQIKQTTTRFTTFQPLEFLTQLPVSKTKMGRKTVSQTVSLMRVLITEGFLKNLNNEKKIWGEYDIER